MELVSLSRLAGSPDRYTQENEILDEKLPGIPQHEKTMWKLERSRCREKKTHREHEGDDGPNAADEESVAENGRKAISRATTISIIPINSRRPEG